MTEVNKKIIKSEIREDHIHDRFVIVAPVRSRRPSDFGVDVAGARPVGSEKKCVFCPEEQKGVAGLCQLGGDGENWRVKVVRNIFPAVSPENNRAYGYQEVVIETREHGRKLGNLPLDHMIEIFEAYAARTRELQKDKKIEYILIFKNEGDQAGASLEHAHSQIFAAGFTPPHIIGKLTRAQEYRIKNGFCYYCHLLAEEEKSPRHIASDEYAVAFTPYASNYQYEAWIIPRKHIDNVTVLDRQELSSIAGLYKQITGKLNEQNIPFNMYLHQSVKDRDEHFYIRVCPRRSTWAGVELGSRIIINMVSPESAASFYRGGN